MKIVNCLLKIATACKIWSQKFETFLILKMQFLGFFFFLKHWIIKSDFHLSSKFIFMKPRNNFGGNEE